MNKKLTESLENYLETIGMLIRKNKIARVKDISKELKVKNSSVNIALNILADKELIIHEINISCDGNCYYRNIPYFL